VEAAHNFSTAVELCNTKTTEEEDVMRHLQMTQILLFVCATDIKHRQNWKKKRS